MVEATKKIVETIVHGLKDQPLILAIVVINVVFIGFASFTLYKIAQRGEERDKLISELAKACFVKPAS